MNDTRTTYRLALSAICALSVAMFAGCGPTYRDLRLAGLRQLAQRDWGTARSLFNDAMAKTPEDAENLHDLGVCSMMLARKQFELQNHPAAMREADRAIEYFSRSTKAFPGYQPAIIGKNRAQELKGQFEEALRTAHWAARYIGPSAKQFMFLGNEYEERGDFDTALLRYRQAAAMDPQSAAAYRAIGLLQHRAGNQPAAIDALTRSLYFDPSQSDVSNLLRELGEPVPAVDTGADD